MTFGIPFQRVHQFLDVLFGIEAGNRWLVDHLAHPAPRLQGPTCLLRRQHLGLQSGVRQTVTLRKASNGPLSHSHHGR